MTIRWPGSGFSFVYGRPWPYQLFGRLLPPATLASGRAGPVVAAQDVLHKPAHQLLLRGDASRRVDHLEVELLRQAIVEVEHPALEEPEALGGRGGEPEVHAGL